MSSSTAPKTLDGVASSPTETFCAQLLGSAGVVALSSALLWGSNLHQSVIEDAAMWLKALGLLCAGVFVGAALVEAKQMLRGQRREAAENETGDDPATTEADDDDRDGLDR